MLAFGDLVTAAGPSGHEGRPSELWRTAAREFCDDVRGDVLGSTTAVLRGRGSGPRVAIMSHIDEIGLLVTHIDEEGRVWFTTVGLWDPLILVGQRIDVVTRAGTVPGVIGRKPVHLSDSSAATQPAPTIRELHIDVGARCRAETRELLEVGDVAVIASTPIELLNGRVVSRALDNRIGCYIALEVGRRVSARGGAAGDVVLVACSQEETTFAGATASAFSVEPDIAIVIDTNIATDVPGVDVNLLGEHSLGSGPGIGRGPILHPRISRLLCETAGEIGITHTVRTQLAGDRTWTDSDAVYLSREGVAVGLISIPTRYLHSPVEMVQLSDVDAAIDLVSTFLTRGDLAESLAR